MQWFRQHAEYAPFIWNTRSRRLVARLDQGNYSTQCSILLWILPNTLI